MADPTPMRERRRLTPVEEGGAADVFVQESPAPVLQDDWPDGFDYVCGHCGEMVLASCVADDQLWALGFRCFTCKKVSLSPALPPGMALPRVTVLVPPEMFPAPITNTIPLGRQTMVGQAAIDRRAAEAGPQGATFRVPNPPPPARGDANFLQGLVDDVRGLLGATFDALDRVDQRRRASQSKKRHPLMVVVQSVRSAIASFATPTPTVDDRWVMELVTLLHTLRRWSGHPLWPTFVQGLSNEYLHTILTLAAATFLEDHGNGVVFHQAASGRGADLLLVVAAQQRVAVEIKVPKILRAPSTALGYDRLLQVIRAAVKGAGTGTKGQLSRHRPGLLVIGGFHLAPADVLDFQRAAAAYLRGATDAGQHAHLMGIGLVWFGSFPVRGPAGWTVRATLHMPVALNPGYRGTVLLMPPRAL